MEKKGEPENPSYSSCVLMNKLDLIQIDVVWADCFVGSRVRRVGWQKIEKCYAAVQPHKIGNEILGV